MKTGVHKRDLLALGFIALLGLGTLFVIQGMVSSTGHFVYTAGRVQLDLEEACDGITDCTDGPAAIVSAISGRTHSQPPGQYAVCICPEHVYAWNNKQPLVYDKTRLRFIRTIQEYKEGAYYAQPKE